MRFNKITINFFAIVGYPLGIYLCYSGRVSWWVLLLIALLTWEFTYTWKRK